MSGRYMDRSESGFVYNAYAEKEWDGVTTDNGEPPYWKTLGAHQLLVRDAITYKAALQAYEHARQDNCTKQDARKHLPMAMATGTYVYWNSSSLMQYFNERLRPATEWEHRRVAQMMFDIVYNIAPAHFEKFKIMLDGCI